MEGPDVRSASHGFQPQAVWWSPPFTHSGCIFEAEVNNKMHLSNKQQPTPPKKKHQKNSRFGLWFEIRLMVQKSQTATRDGAKAS